MLSSRATYCSTNECIHLFYFFILVPHWNGTHNPGIVNAMLYQLSPQDMSLIKGEEQRATEPAQPLTVLVTATYWRTKLFGSLLIWPCWLVCYCWFGGNAYILCLLYNWFWGHIKERIQTNGNAAAPNSHNAGRVKGQDTIPFHGLWGYSLQSFRWVFFQTKYYSYNFFPDYFFNPVLRSLVLLSRRTSHDVSGQIQKGQGDRSRIWNSS